MVAHTTTIPHRALAVDEILREVTAYVTDTHPPTAVALARCAKFLEEPALSTLWKVQNQPPPLIRTLPPDSWELLPVNDRGRRAIVRNSPQLHELFTLVPDSKLTRGRVGFGYRHSLEPCRR